MIRAELFRFIETLDHTTVSEDEWRLANVINDYLDPIIPLGTAAGRRSKFILNIAYPNFDSLSAHPPQAAQERSQIDPRLRRLNTLKVGPFRGFGREHDFDLSNQVVLLYGPNGTGKSSFCEALEFALLGTVNDCSAKRIEVDAYLKNARTESFEIPKLTALYENGEPVEVVANDDIYRFCFVEKNRIDDFSRIASFTPNQQERLIASLFGIEEFNSFVGNFNENIENYLTNDSSAARDLPQLETSLASSRQIASEKDEQLKALAGEEENLAGSFQEGMGYNAFVLAVGTTDGGKIKELTDKLSQPLRTKIGAVRLGLIDAVKSVRSSWGARSVLQETRLAMADDLSYRDLYRSVIALERSNPETCPACDTPLLGARSVASNPYVKARTALEGLTKLAEVERLIEVSTRQLENRANGLLTQLVNLEANLTEAENQDDCAVALHGAIAAGRAEITGNWWHDLLGFTDDSAATVREFLLGCIERIERRDELLSQQETLGVKQNGQKLNAR